MARRMSGAWSPPRALGEAIQHELDHPDLRQLDSPRHTITVDAPVFRQRLLRELPDDFIRTRPVTDHVPDGRAAS